MRRWSDDDKRFWRFTYSASGHGTGFMLCSGEDGRPGCHLRLHALRRTLIVELPPILWPHRRKVAAHWDAATIARLGRDWYWDEHEREIGVILHEDALHVRYGAQTMDSSSQRSSVWFLPWMEWRHVRESLYGLDGRPHYTKPQGLNWELWRAIEDAAPSASFEFDDFDGERIVARTRIEEMEWRLGKGLFRWLSVFRRPRIRRSLEIEFSKETGKRKGSWKGGTIGHGIEMQPGELHEAAFRRYCAENQMRFVGQATNV